MLISHMVWIDLKWEGIRYNGHKENIISPLTGAIKGYDNVWQYIIAYVAIYNFQAFVIKG